MNVKRLVVKSGMNRGDPFVFTPDGEGTSVLHLSFTHGEEDGGRSRKMDVRVAPTVVVLTMALWKPCSPSRRS